MATIVTEGGAGGLLDRLTSGRSLVVDHETDLPAEDCLVAAEIAGVLARAGAAGEAPRFVRLRGRGREFSQPGSAEHVTAYGALVANGLVWAERALGRPLDLSADEEPGSAGSSASPEVIAFNARLFPVELIMQLRQALVKRTGPALWIRVETAGGNLAPVLVSDAGATVRPLGVWHRDGFGRLVPRSSADLPEEIFEHLGLRVAGAGHGRLPAPTFSAGPAATSGGSPRILVVGEPLHLQLVYPSVLAVLGDAADSVRLSPAVQIVSPRGLSAADCRHLLRTVDGVVLPGGSDMGEARGQIRAATAALELGVPTVGLCLGMQTMAAAVARSRAGLADGDLEEVNPLAPTFVVKRLRGEDQRPYHRLGAQTVRIRPGTRLAEIYRRAEVTERLNHRYHLNLDILPALEAAGLTANAVSADGRVVDGIEYGAHRFFLGLQGHPELSSRPDAPHPLVCAFLVSAAGAGRSAAGN